ELPQRQAPVSGPSRRCGGGGGPDRDTLTRTSERGVAVRHRHQMRRRAALGGGRGFTLIELLVVMFIIGLLLSLILTAAMNGVRTAEERATQALIAKLEAGMADRIDAILSTRVEPNAAHLYLATGF